MSFEVEFQVRSYELDSLGHLNNAVYFSYLEEATFAFLAEHALPFARFKELGWYPIVAHAAVDYRREIVSGDSIVVRGWPHRYGNTSMELGYHFLRQRANGTSEVVAEAKRVWVFVHLERGKIPVPPEIRAAFGEPTDQPSN